MRSLVHWRRTVRTAGQKWEAVYGQQFPDFQIVNRRGLWLRPPPARAAVVITSVSRQDQLTGLAEDSGDANNPQHVVGLSPSRVRGRAAERIMAQGHRHACRGHLAMQHLARPVRERNLPVAGERGGSRRRHVANPEHRTGVRMKCITSARVVSGTGFEANLCAAS